MIDPDTSLAILQGQQAWQADTMPNLIPSLLPANERRRVTAIIKLALQTIQPLLKPNDDLGSIATVFASSYGDMAIVDKICCALDTDEKMISPTQFHNSVHNAPAGYWAIASSMSGPSVSLSAGQYSFSVGLLEAISQVCVENDSVLLVAYDEPLPDCFGTPPMIDVPLGIAMRLGPKAEPGTLGCCSIELDAQQKEVSVCRNKSLEVLRHGNAIGAGLPLMEALARRARMQVVLPYLDHNILVKVTH